MPILNIQISQAGLTDVKPNMAYIHTDDPLATALATGYLNQEVSQGASFTLPCAAVLATKETGATDYNVGLYQVVHQGGNWSLEAQSQAIQIVYADQYTTTGGSASETISVPGVKATDKIFTQVKDNGTANVTILEAEAAADGIDLTFSGNPGADCVLYYQVVRKS